MAAELWDAVGGDADALATLRITGERRVLPSCFDVTGLATAAVAAANLAVAELIGVRTGEPPPPVTIHTRAAAAAFVGERLFSPDGWELPPAWDAIAGDYETTGGWIKLHTNYRAHRQAALTALGLAEGSTRAAVAAAVSRRDGDELEEAVVDAGGCAAVLRTVDEWAVHPHGRAVAGEPLVRTEAGRARSAATVMPTDASAHRALDGVRVLDLTRVIAGPVGTRFLAAHGAQVLRLDPPGFAEVVALVPETTWGKRCAALDLSDPGGRQTFARLVNGADVVVHGLRPGALERLGFGVDELRALNPELVVATLDAYGWEGPWAGRRGFDSLVQMSSGIAAAGMAATAAGPQPLPAQALDHATGFLLAAAVVRALARGRADTIRTSLVATANALLRRPDGDGLDGPDPVWVDADLDGRETAWGPARGVAVPGVIGGHTAGLRLPAGPLGRAEPAFVD